ncbi:dihydroorotase [Breznakiellaceae bacterium SP9]
MTILRNFHIVDANTNAQGSVFIEHGRIQKVILKSCAEYETYAEAKGARVIDGSRLSETLGQFSGSLPLLMPAFIDLHAHFRDPGPTDKETLETACLAAAAGGFGTVVCMANTKPVTDTLGKAAELKARADMLGLIDVLPVLSLTMNMEGKELSGLTAIERQPRFPRLLSEDGKDVYDDALFLAAMHEAARIGIPISCHCDKGGFLAQSTKQSGAARELWSRFEENDAVKRALSLGEEAGCRIHIAHVSTKEAVAVVRTAKRTNPAITCEVSPHHLALTDADAAALGSESFGRVNPPLRENEDRAALIEALLDGTIDAIATDHAPHTLQDKTEGAPGFSGLETAFSVCYTELIAKEVLPLERLSALMSANPAHILGLQDRGRIEEGLRSDIVLVNPAVRWTVDPKRFKSKGKNSPFAGRELYAKVIQTLHNGSSVYNG